MKTRNRKNVLPKMHRRLLGRFCSNRCLIEWKPTYTQRRETVENRLSNQNHKYVCIIFKLYGFDNKQCIVSMLFISLLHKQAHYCFHCIFNWGW